MAKTTKPKHPGTGHTCGQCARGTWSDKHTNRDTNGQPFLKLCEFSTFSRNKDGQAVCLRSTHACEHFKEGMV